MHVVSRKKHICFVKNVNIQAILNFNTIQCIKCSAVINVILFKSMRFSSENVSRREFFVCSHTYIKILESKIYLGIKKNLARNPPPQCSFSPRLLQIAVCLIMIQFSMGFDVALLCENSWLRILEPKEHRVILPTTWLYAVLTLHHYTAV